MNVTDIVSSSTDPSSSSQIQTIKANSSGSPINNTTDTADTSTESGNKANASSHFIFLGLDPASNSHILNGIIIFATLTVIANCVVLVASKYTTGGKSSTLVFIRSLCIADMLVGLFGIFKCVLLINLDSRLINCFLPESVFVSASTTICLTLLWLNVDSYLRLSKPFGYVNSMDKHNVIIAMTVLWNGAFIIGFLPQMGWNNEEYVCNFFTFYRIEYIIFVGCIWLGCMFGSCFMQVVLYKTRRKIEQNDNFISPRSLEYRKHTQLIATIKNDIITLTLCYLPLLVYITVYFINERHKLTQLAHVNLIYFLPLFLGRSFIGAFIHSYRTIRIQRLMREVSKSINVSLFRTMCNEVSSDGSPSVLGSVARPRMNSIATLDTKRVSVRDREVKNGKWGLNATRVYRPMCSTTSIISTVIEDEELTETSELTQL